MLIRQSTLAGIRDGSIGLAFRRWKRPTVRAGGSLMTALGRLAIGSVEPVDVESITPAEARRAGFATAAELADALGDGEGQVYRIELGPLGEDPRVALREREPDGAELEQLGARLARMDSRSDRPWTLETLRLIDAHPGVRAGDLATRVDMERLPFKANVRKLKTLGLTISLETGYELSPRGRAVTASLGGRRDTNAS